MMKIGILSEEKNAIDCRLLPYKFAGVVPNNIEDIKEHTLQILNCQTSYRSSRSISLSSINKSIIMSREPRNL